jgi:hypothetical protein
MRPLAGAAALFAGAYAAQTWLTDSTYGQELSHRPLAIALWAAMSLVDWSEGVKFIVVAAGSLAVMIDSGRRLFGGVAVPRPAAARTPHARRHLGLEIAR